MNDEQCRTILRTLNNARAKFLIGRYLIFFFLLITSLASWLVIRSSMWRILSYNLIFLFKNKKRIAHLGRLSARKISGVRGAGEHYKWIQLCHSFMNYDSWMRRVNFRACSTPNLGLQAPYYALFFSPWRSLTPKNHALGLAVRAYLSVEAWALGLRI